MTRWVWFRIRWWYWFLSGPSPSDINYQPLKRGWERREPKYKEE